MVPTHTSRNTLSPIIGTQIPWKVKGNSDFQKKFHQWRCFEVSLPWEESFEKPESIWNVHEFPHGFNITQNAGEIPWCCPSTRKSAGKNGGFTGYHHVWFIAWQFDYHYLLGGSSHLVSRLVLPSYSFTLLIPLITRDRTYFVSGINHHLPSGNLT